MFVMVDVSVGTFVVVVVVVSCMSSFAKKTVHFIIILNFIIMLIHIIIHIIIITHTIIIVVVAVVGVVRLVVLVLEEGVNVVVGSLKESFGVLAVQET